MNDPILYADVTSEILERFAKAGIDVVVERRDYPEESVFIVRVPPDSLVTATMVGTQLDHELASRGLKGFLAIRATERAENASTGRLTRGVADTRATKLMSLLMSRSRTSEVQPSLAYVPDSSDTIATALTARHHLIFGRRGAGKTALLVETKRQIEQNGYQSVWINLQTYRYQSTMRTFASICDAACERIQSFYMNRTNDIPVSQQVTQLRDELQRISSQEPMTDAVVHPIIPKMRALIARFVKSNAIRLYLFIDELHYIIRGEQPKLLDMLHAIVRDSDAWLKIAGIKHLCRWFTAQPPTGLQTGHDADQINLDVTLEDPTRAKSFLERVLGSYAHAVDISSNLSIFSNVALDRLVLASGAVPRDYLVLSAVAVRQARIRAGARLVGVQDVNRAAGELANGKLVELEEDAASAEQAKPIALGCLQLVRKFCIEQKKWTFFRIDFRDKEGRSTEYGAIQDLMDLRLLHLVESSLSDEHHAGRRSEVYVLDLSQFSGQRLRKHLRVLDFSSGYIVLKETGGTTPAKKGATPKQRLALLRRGPLFDLQSLSGLVAKPLAA